MTDQTAPRRWAPTWAIVLVVVIVAALVAVAARQVTTSLRDDQPARPVAAVTPDASGALPPPSLAPPEPGQLAPGTGSDPIIGAPHIEPVDREPVPDRVTLEPGQLPDFSGPLPGAAPPDPQPTPEDPGGGDFSLDLPDVTTGEVAPDPVRFGVGIRAIVGGHFATVVVGVIGGPDGLASLSVDFGDGGSYQPTEDELDQLRDGGTLRLVHRYEPTLTPQPQRAMVSATDGAGQSKQAAYEFETRAEFLLRFSPMTVTAQEDCDTFGKNDFELYWNLDGTDHSNRFDLGKGESHVEKRFQTDIDDIHYPDRIHYDWGIVERDFAGGFFQPWDWEFAVPYRFAEVIELGTHHFPVTTFYTTRNSCHVRVDYTYSMLLLVS